MKKRPIKILQWNARSLFCAKLQELKANLHKHNPLIVLLSETQWKDDYTIRCSAYNSFPDRKFCLEQGFLPVIPRPPRRDEI